MISKFVYVIEKLSNNGWISIYSNDEHLTENKEEGIILTFTNEVDLLDALKQYKKGGVRIIETNEDLFQIGKNFAEKLNLEFIHPF